MQLWDEAKCLYGQGETLYLNEQENSEALSEQIDALETDERQVVVEEVYFCRITGTASQAGREELRAVQS